MSSRSTWAGGCCAEAQRVRRARPSRRKNRSRRAFPRRDWAIAALVAGAQLPMVTLLGGAVLDRYLLPVLPILYAAFATAASAYPAAWRWTSHTALIAMLLLSWVWNPPYPFQYEDNLAMVDFVELQRSAAGFLEINAPTRRIASMWPFTGAIGNPEFGYVERPLRPVSLESFELPDLADLDRRSFDLLVVYSRQYPMEGSWLDVAPLDALLRRLPGYHPQATHDELSRERLSFAGSLGAARAMDRGLCAGHSALTRPARRAGAASSARASDSQRRRRPRPLGPCASPTVTLIVREAHQTK